MEDESAAVRWKRLVFVKRHCIALYLHGLFVFTYVQGYLHQKHVYLDFVSETAETKCWVSWLRLKKTIKFSITESRPDYLIT